MFSDYFDLLGELIRVQFLYKVVQGIGEFYVLNKIGYLLSDVFEG